jgi:hypothetical protein
MYRVWKMDPVFETDHEYYQETITHVMGTPDGLESVILNVDDFRCLKIALERFSSSNRPRFYYQPVEKGINELVTEFVEKGRELSAEHEERLARLKADEKKRRIQAEKKKAERERKKYEKLKAKFGE